MDISKIPELTPNLNNETKNFKVIINGNPNNVTSVKSFTWVNPIGSKQKILNSETKTTQEQNQQNEIKKENYTNVTVEKTQPKEKIYNQNNFLDNIPDEFN
jgi:hypothetical protein